MQALNELGITHLIEINNTAASIYGRPQDYNIVKGIVKSESVIDYLNGRSHNIGLKSCYIERCIKLPMKCKVCYAFGHKTCDNITCPRCAESHHLEECDSEILRCINCDQDHLAMDRTCPTYKDIKYEAAMLDARRRNRVENKQQLYSTIAAKNNPTAKKEAQDTTNSIDGLKDFMKNLFNSFKESVHDTIDDKINKNNTKIENQISAQISNNITQISSFVFDIAEIVALGQAKKSEEIRDVYNKLCKERESNAQLAKKQLSYQIDSNSNLTQANLQQAQQSQQKTQTQQPTQTSSSNQEKNQLSFKQPNLQYTNLLSNNPLKNQSTLLKPSQIPNPKSNPSNTTNKQQIINNNTNSSQNNFNLSNNSSNVHINNNTNINSTLIDFNNA
jgi:hypothetical protein